MLGPVLVGEECIVIGLSETAGQQCSILGWGSGRMEQGQVGGNWDEGQVGLVEAEMSIMELLQSVPATLPVQTGGDEL